MLHMYFHNPVVPFASREVVPSIGPALLAARQLGVAAVNLATCQENVESLAAPSSSGTSKAGLCIIRK